MKYLKMPGLAAAAATALMVFAGTASATTVTSSEGATPSLVATSTNSKFDGAFVTLECSHSSFEVQVEDHGASKAVSGDIASLGFSGCNYSITVKKTGSVEIHGDGSLTWSGVELVMHTSVGACVYTTQSNKLGTITGGSPSTLDIGPGHLPRTGGSFLCGSYSDLTGSYVFTAPSSLWVD